MISDVVFVTPNTGGTIVDEAIGTLQLASILQEQGVSCQILPFFKIGNVDDFDSFIENAATLLAQSRCRIVSFYCRCDSFHVSLRLAQLVKERCPGVYTVLGGPQADITAEETIRQLSWVDYVCCGEGETTIYPLFSSLLAGLPNLSVPGLVYRQGDQVIVNPRPALLEDLDSLPMIDYSLMSVKGELTASPMTIDVGRGCPFACTFCSTNSFWGRKYRLKSPQRIRDEVQIIHDTFGQVSIEFAHDMFTLNREKVMETCRLLKELDFPVKWCCSARLDCVDPELIDIMVDAGLYGIYFGVETGSPRMQKLVRKNLKLDDALDIIAYARSKNLHITTSFIFGFPEETEEDLSLTMALIAKLLKMRVVVHTHLCAFMVGTELSRRYQAELTPVEYYSDQTGEHAVKDCKDLISGHPQLFQQLLEYKTELRSKLRHFELFYLVWRRNQTVYDYLAEQYPPERMIDMYYDFVDANRQRLETIYELPTDWSTEMLLKDRFPERFADDKNYDIIRDLCQYVKISLSDTVKNGGVANAVFCVNPMDAPKKSLQDCQRCVAVVTWKDNRHSVICYPYIPK